MNNQPLLPEHNCALVCFVMAPVHALFVHAPVVYMCVCEEVPVFQSQSYPALVK